jgi:FkbM family methyltransferase
VRSLGRSVAKFFFHLLLSMRVPLPAPARDFVRRSTRAYFHRTPFFRHDSRLYAGPLIMRVVHECLVRTCPADFDIYQGRLRFRSSGSPMSLHGYYVGEFEYHLIRFIVDHLRADSIVLDIGAHHGEFAVPLAYEMKTRQWSSKVWSFEPDPENFRCLQHNLSINGLSAHAELRMVAVSDQATESTELLCPFDNSSNTLSRNAAYAIGDELPTVKRRLVKTVRIDDIDFGPAAIAIVKIDIQGSEPDALLGAMATLTRHRPIVVVEVVESWPRAADVERILSGLGYTIHGLAESGELVPIHDRRVFVSWDWIAMPGTKAADASIRSPHTDNWTTDATDRVGVS